MHLVIFDWLFLEDLSFGVGNVLLVKSSILLEYSHLVSLLLLRLLLLDGLRLLFPERD